MRREEMEPLRARKLPPAAYRNPRVALAPQGKGSLAALKTTDPFLATSTVAPSRRRVIRSGTPACGGGPIGVLLRPHPPKTSSSFCTKICGANAWALKRPSKMKQVAPAVHGSYIVNAIEISPSSVGHPSVLMVCLSAAHVTGASPPQHARPGVSVLVSQAATMAVPWPGPD